MAFTVAYWKRLLEDAVTAFSAGVLSVFGSGALDVIHADWGKALSIGAGAAVLFVLKGLATKNAGDPTSTHASGAKPEDTFSNAN